MSESRRPVGHRGGNVKTFTKNGMSPTSEPRALELDEMPTHRRRLCPASQNGGVRPVFDASRGPRGQRLSAGSIP